MSANASTLAVAWSKLSKTGIFDAKTNWKKRAEIDGAFWAISPDGATLLSSQGKSLQFWDLRTQMMRKSVSMEWAKIVPGADRYKRAVFSPDGATLAYYRGGVIKVIDVALGTEKWGLNATATRVADLVFHPDGETIFAGHSSRVDVLGTKTGRSVNQLQVGGVFAVSPDGKVLATGDGLGRIRLWDAQTGESQKPLRDPNSLIVRGALSPDGKHLALGLAGGMVSIVEVATFREQRTFQKFTYSVLRIAYSPDGQYLATSAAHSPLKVWHLRTGLELNLPKGVTEFAFSPDGTHLAVGYADDKIFLWNLLDERQVSEFPADKLERGKMFFTPDGKKLLNGRKDGPVIVREIPSGKKLLTFGKPPPGQHAHLVYFTPDGKWATFYGGGEFGWWPFYDLTTGKQIRLTQLSKAWAQWRKSHAFASPDRKTVAVGKSGINLYDAVSGQLKHSIPFPNCHDNGYIRPLFAPDGRHAITVNGNGTVYVLRLAAK